MIKTGVAAAFVVIALFVLIPVTSDGGMMDGGMMNEGKMCGMMGK